MRKSISKIQSREAVAIYYLGSFLINFAGSLTFAIYTIFLYRNGLDYFQMNLINTIFMVAIVLLEVPTGAIADCIGRKKAVLISSALAVIGYLYYAVSKSFFGFAIAEVLIALSMTFSYGAFEAWMVDIGTKQGFKGKFDLIFSQAGIYSKTAAIAGGIIGAYLSKISLVMPFYVGAFIALGVFLTLQFLMVEDSSKDRMSLGKISKKFVDTIVGATKYSLSHKTLIWVMAGAAFFSLCSQPLNMYWGVRFDEMLGGKLEMMGWIWAAITLFALAGIQITKHLLKRNVNYAFIVVSSVIVISPMIILSATSQLPFIAISGFLIHELGRGIYQPIQLSYVNKFAEETKRATILSFDSMITAAGSAFGLVGFGLLARKFDIETSWIIAGILMLFSAFFYLKAQKTTKEQE